MTIQQDKITPAMKQFHHYKQLHPDCILFFRMGDFYETFYKDAQICSQVCGLTLTSRSKGENPVPLAGVPYHAIDAYLKKMIKAGYRVAVCEQVEDPKQAKGVVKRDVVRIITPGTLTDDNLLDEKLDNFLCAVSLNSKNAAISWVDISTGHFFSRVVPESAVVDEILRIAPAECVLPETRGELFGAEVKKLATQVEQLAGAVITFRPAWYFEPYDAQKRLLEHFGVKTLEGFGIKDDSPVISSAGAIIEYLKETQKTALGHITNIKIVEQKKFLQIDQTTLRSLEVLSTIRAGTQKGSLVESVDKTLTGMGARMFRYWLCMPLFDVGAIVQRQDAIEELLEKKSALEQLRGILKNYADLERIVGRVSTLRAGPRDLFALLQSLKKTEPIKKILADFKSEIFVKLTGRCDGMPELAAVLESAIEPESPTHLRDGGVIKAGFNAELDELRGISKDARTFLAQYQQKEIERTGIANLKIGFNNVFGYYIEINHSNANKTPADYVRKQTVKNAERYITDELKKYEEKILTAGEKSLELEQRIFEQVRKQCADCIDRIMALADVIAACDCLCGLGSLAAARNYIRPKITGGMELTIIDGKHPVLAEMLANEFVPNDVELGGGSGGDVAIITGPNMSGKSTYIRQTALLVLLAQTGSFIPAKQATIGIADRIFTRVGASDELIRGQSTFMVEMTETANIINNATEKSLVILDEVGRGTSTYDGLSLAWAITEHIANKIKCRTLFATHYHELTALAGLLVNVKNCNVAVREWMDEVVFLHKIVPGGTDKSYGIHVAKLAGIPKSITERSREILDDLENTFQKEAGGEKLTKQRTKETDIASLFDQKQKDVLERLKSLDVNNLTPIQAINLLTEIKEFLAK
ncbi:MAG TPA: DNA mismatch repair protein MutS [Phycisphaerales bacterium]|nr:MAG: DNA mismatch repair protein MutS [Planctomycetes bacterium GWC2_45_44]HBG78811.1 DNA mismatch repair protein MutS [Phycisphaerales bacterium]HBR20308.1 DNA mismatch repair protein MutS [Phycisphaerales bacterium]